MAKSRSPRYPSLTIIEALERVRKIYDKDHMNPIAKEVIVQHLGYTGLNGASLTMLGSLRRYGLLEPQGELLRVSRDAVALLELPPVEPGYREAFRRVIFTPELFSELRDTLGTVLPSEASLRHTLIQKGFIPSAAKEVIRVYNENIKLAASLEDEYSEKELKNGDENESMIEEKDKENVPVKSMPETTAGSTHKAYPVDVSIPRNVRAELRISGELKREDLEKLKRQLNRILDGIQDAFED